MEYQKLELAAGDDQLLVLFVNNDTSEMVDPSAFVQALADDASARRPNGWRLVSVSALPLRQTGTLGNVFWQSGGQYATQAGLLAIYAIDPAHQPDSVKAGSEREPDEKAAPVEPSTA